jgi:hypothetical protein
LDNKIAKVIDPQDRYLRHLTDRIMAFWIKHGLDTRHGGFYGGLDRKGNPSPSLPKGLVQHARFLWSFSAAYRLDPQPVYHDMANRSFNFLREHFYDPARLGWYYLVSAEGLPLNKQKHLYGQSFVIYGLSEYFLAFGNEEALKLALETFGVMDKFGHDSQWRGYRESFSEEEVRVPANASVKVRHLSFHELGIKDPRQEYSAVRSRSGILSLSKGGLFPDNRHFFVEVKDLVRPKPNLTVEINERDNGTYEVRVVTDTYAYFVKLTVPIESTRFSDNYFDLFPGQERVIEVWNEAGQRLEESDIAVGCL